MLPLPNIEEINDHLLAIPRIVQIYEARDSTFSEHVKTWLLRAEEILQNNRLPITGAIAALRASIVSAERGVVPNGMTFVAASTPRKCRDAAAAEALRRAEQTIADTIRADAAQLAEAERLLRQMVAVARYKGYIGNSNGMPHDAVLNSLWNRFRSDNDLAQGAVRIEGLIGAANALALLDREAR